VKQRVYTLTRSQTVHLLNLLALSLLTIAFNAVHFEASCSTCHCAFRPFSCHPLLHFHSNFLHAPSRHPFQGIENRERYRHKNAFVDRGAAHPRRCIIWDIYKSVGLVFKSQQRQGSPNKWPRITPRHDLTSVKFFLVPFWLSVSVCGLGWCLLSLSSEMKSRPLGHVCLVGFFSFNSLFAGLLCFFSVS